jgi:hypothetical protein
LFVFNINKKNIINSVEGAQQQKEEGIFTASLVLLDIH